MSESQGKMKISSWQPTISPKTDSLLTRIAFYPLDFIQWRELSLELESLIIQAVNPPYNVKIPARD